MSDLFGEDWVWLLLRLAVLSGAAFAAAWLATFLTMAITLVPYFRSRSTEWSELARLSWGGRRLGVFCLILVPAPIVVGATSELHKYGATTSYVAAFVIAMAAWVGVVSARVEFNRRIVPAFAMTPRATRNQFISNLILMAGILGIPFAALVVGGWNFLRVVPVTGLGIVMMTAHFLWGWQAGLRVLGVIRSASDRLERVMASVSEAMGIRPRSLVEMGVPVANALAFPHLGRVACTPALLSILNDEELATILAHELAHLSEPRQARGTRLARPFASSCLIMSPVALFLASRARDSTSAALWAFALYVLIFVLIVYLGRSRVLLRRMEVRADEFAKRFEPTPGVYAQALEKLHRANLVPMVLIARNLTHPNLYDRLVALGARPDYPRPEPPPRRLEGLGILVALGLAIASGYGMAALGRALEPAASEPDDSVVRVILQEPGQLLEVRARLNKTNHGDHRLGIDELLEGDVVQVELARDRDEHAVKPIFHERPKRPHAKLAPQHDVKGVRRSTPGLIAKLNPVHSPFAAGSLLVLGLDELGQRRRELGLGQ